MKIGSVIADAHERIEQLCVAKFISCRVQDGAGRRSLPQSWNWTESRVLLK
jgi:hypothetical protein